MAAALVGLAGCAYGEVAPAARVAPTFPPTPAPPPVSWDAASGELACGLLQQVAVPADLRQLVELDGNDEAEIVLREQTHGALVVTARALAHDTDISDVPYLSNLLVSWVDLFEKVEPDWPALKVDGVNVRYDNGRLVMDYASSAPLLQWRLVYVKANDCRIAALERVGPDDKPRLTALLDDLRGDF